MENCVLITDVGDLKTNFYLSVKIQNPVVREDGVKLPFLCLAHYTFALNSSGVQKSVQIRCKKVLNVHLLRVPRLSALFSHLFLIFFSSPIKIKSTVVESLFEICTKRAQYMSMYGTSISEGYKRRKGYQILIVQSVNFSIYKHFPKFPFAPLLRTQWCEETLLNDASGIEKGRPCFPRLFIDSEVFPLHALAVSHLSFPSSQASKTNL